MWLWLYRTELTHGNMVVTCTKQDGFAVVEQTDCSGKSRFLLYFLPLFGTLVSLENSKEAGASGRSHHQTGAESGFLFSFPTRVLRRFNLHVWTSCDKHDTTHTNTGLNSLPTQHQSTPACDWPTLHPSADPTTSFAFNIRSPSSTIWPAPPSISQAPSSISQAPSSLVPTPPSLVKAPSSFPPPCWVSFTTTPQPSGVPPTLAAEFTSPS